VLAVGSNSVAAPYAVLEVTFDSAGARERARIVETTISADAAEALVRTVVPTAPWVTGGNGESWGVLLRATADGDAATFEVEQMEYCACALTNRREFGRLLQTAVRRLRIPELSSSGSTLTLIVDVRSDITGAIVEKRLHQSTGHAGLDAAVLQIADQMRVAPPLLNRQPIATWSRIPISLTF